MGEGGRGNREVKAEKDNGKGRTERGGGREGAMKKREENKRGGWWGGGGERAG